MIIDSFADLITAYLETLRGRASHTKMCYVASHMDRHTHNHSDARTDSGAASA